MVLQSKDVNEIVRTCLKSEDFQVISCEPGDTSDISGGYLSAQDKARIRFKSGQREGELHIFIKVLPDSPCHRDIILELGSFSREVILFNEVFHKYSDFIKDNTIPRCYSARPEIIVMEDMTKKGFKNKPLHETLDLKHCEKSLEALAKFHALSLIVENKERRKLTELVSVIRDEVFASKKENYVGRKVVLNSIRCMKRVIEEYMTDVPSEVVKKAFHYLDNFFDEMKSSERYPNVLLHGDLWINNLMFSYDKQGNVVETCIFDFQQATYKPPAYDIHMLLHCCTETELRDRHFDHLMKHYYAAFSTTLHTAGLVAQDILSWQDFQKMINDTLPVGLTIGCLWLIFVLVPDFITKDVMSSGAKFKEYFAGDRVDFTLMAMKEHREYNRRMTQAVKKFLNCFYT